MRIVIFIFSLLFVLFGLQKWATYSKGVETYIPYLVGFVILSLIVFNFKKLYTNAGWLNVSCKTSSENGERAGLTGLQLYK